MAERRLPAGGPALHAARLLARSRGTQSDGMAFHRCHLAPGAVRGCRGGDCAYLCPPYQSHGRRRQPRGARAGRRQIRSDRVAQCLPRSPVYSRRLRGRGGQNRRALDLSWDPPRCVPRDSAHGEARHLHGHDALAHGSGANRGAVDRRGRHQLVPTAWTPRVMRDRGEPHGLHAPMLAPSTSSSGGVMVRASLRLSCKRWGGRSPVRNEPMEYTQASAASLAQAQERIRGTFIELIGLRIIEVTSERAVAQMPFMPQLQQLTGVFHAGALLTLADTTATFACMYWSSGTIDGSTEQFPLTIQLSTNFIRNTNQGTVRAKATPVHRGRTTMVVETRVSDAAGRLLMIVTTTHLLVGR